MALDEDVRVVNGAIRAMAEQCRQRAVADWIAFEENTLLLAGDYPPPHHSLCPHSLLPSVSAPTLSSYPLLPSLRFGF